MLFEIQRHNERLLISPDGLAPAPPSSLGLLEKHIEDWIASHPKILLPGEQVLILARSVSGQSMADVLALDSAGRLIVVEIKRDWSNRDTIGQLLEYAARLNGCGFTRLEQYARQYRRDVTYDLLADFQRSFPDAAIAREELGSAQRVVVVAPEADENLRSIVEWLAQYQVPIQFVPFSVFADETGIARYFQIAGVTAVAERPSSEDGWAGHWIFNTNETHAPGAYKAMFREGVAAIYGYPNGPENLEGARPGDFVMAYVNQQGLRAVGRVQDGRVDVGSGVFLDSSGNQLPSEYHLRVDWEAIVEAPAAVSAREASASFGYQLPVRSVFAKLHQGRDAGVIERELRKRASVASAV